MGATSVHPFNDPDGRWDGVGGCLFCKGGGAEGGGRGATDLGGLDMEITDEGRCGEAGESTGLAGA